MKLLEDRIIKDGLILNNEILKVDNFINHMIDVSLINEIGKDMADHFKNEKITKVVTIETSGIAIAYACAVALGNVPIVFAKKQKSKITSDNVYVANVVSFTKGIDYPVAIDKRYLTSEDTVLIVDDFLATGEAGNGLINICEQANAKVVGFCAAIEKGFQGGRRAIESRDIKVYSSAVIEGFVDNKVVFKH